MVHAIDSQIDALGNRPLIRGGEQISEYAKPSPLFSPSLALVSSLRSSRLIARTSNLSKAIDRRQSNFHRLAQALSTLPNATPLYREIAETDVPYMFPLRINHPEPHFYWLKRLGVPVWRWDEMALSDCAVAQDYRLHLIHLPCHQSLTEKQMEWMIIALQKTMRQPTREACDGTCKQRRKLQTRNLTSDPARTLNSFPLDNTTLRSLSPGTILKARLTGSNSCNTTFFRKTPAYVTTLLLKTIGPRRFCHSD